MHFNNFSVTTREQGAGRESPLLIGSVKSNVGNTGAVNGFAALCKAIIAMEKGVVPATINYQTPNAGVEGLLQGRLKVGAACCSARWVGYE